MPQTTASIFQVVEQNELKNLESNFFISPIFARNAIYCCAAVYSLFSITFLMCVYSFQLHEGLESASVNKIIFTPMMLYCLLLLSSAVISYFSVNSYHKKTAIALFYTINAIILGSSIAIYMIFSSSQNLFTSSFEKDCQNPQSEFYQLDLLYKNSSQLLCSSKCPCTIENPSVYPDTIIQNLTLSQEDITGSQFVQNCDVKYQTPGELLYFSNQFKFLEENYHCAGLCDGQHTQLYIFSNINNGLPKRSCGKALSDYLSQVFDLFVHLNLLMGVTALVNCLFIQVLTSRYILYVNDEDLYGKDSEGEDDDLISNYSRVGGSTLDTIKNRFKRPSTITYDQSDNKQSAQYNSLHLPIQKQRTLNNKVRTQDVAQPRTFLNLDSENTLMRRRKLLSNHSGTSSVNHTLPLPLIVEKRESEIFDNFIDKVGRNLETPNSLLESPVRVREEPLSGTPRFMMMKQLAKINTKIEEIKEENQDHQ